MVELISKGCSLKLYLVEISGTENLYLYCIEMEGLNGEEFDSKIKIY